MIVQLVFTTMLYRARVAKVSFGVLQWRPKFFDAKVNLQIFLCNSFCNIFSGDKVGHCMEDKFMQRKCKSCRFEGKFMISSYRCNSVDTSFLRMCSNYIFLVFSGNSPTLTPTIKPPSGHFRKNSVGGFILNGKRYAIAMDILSLIPMSIML